MKHIVSKLHIPIGVGVIIIILVHMLMTYSVWNARALLIMLSGGVTALAILAMAASYLFRKKLKGNWIKLHRVIAVVILVGLVSHIITYYVDFCSYKKGVRKIEISNVDLSAIKDGDYEGEYDVGYIKAKVMVKVKEQRIVSIKILEHKTERGKKAEKITEDIIEKQNVTVDTVSGATNSSLVIQKAVEAALLKG
ncbi:MAG: FMN-binding protein [bacterium]|nr:FMN-binding protein [bacterium]